MELVGHLTRRMLERYTHPPTARKQAALQTFDALLADETTALGAPWPHARWSTRGVSTTWPQNCGLSFGFGGD
jgi:hypothetical protein